MLLAAFTVAPNAALPVVRVAMIASGLFSLLGGLVWTAWLLMAIRRDRHRLGHGLCMRCGYDLRHSRDRCSECGEPIRELKSPPRVNG